MANFENNNVATELSDIQKYFSSSTIFLTGGTGFIGKLLIEKIFRTCPNITKIFMLVREKKGKNINERFEDMLKHPIFDNLKLKNIDFNDKICLIPGDTFLPNLGISEFDWKRLTEEVTCVFHCAATVRFDEKVRLAAYINARATRDLLFKAKQMKKLNSFVYISTAYSNCIHHEVKEQLYDSGMIGDKFLQLVDSVDDEFLETIKLQIIGKWPNTYTFSKSIAEHYIRVEGKKLPIAIVRPSIIIFTNKEPVPGWIDNVYGPAGCLTGVGLGLIHTVNLIKKYKADMVPADVVVNCAIAAAWATSTTQSNFGDCINIEKKTSIYNCVSSSQNPITWNEFIDAMEIGRETPSTLAIWYPFVVINSSYFMHFLFTILLHQIPAYIADYLAVLIGKQPMLVKGYKKIDKFLDVLSYFGINEWDFRNENTQELWKKLSKQDQSLYDFNIKNLKWDEYIPNYLAGARLYLLNESKDTIPQAKTKYNILRIAHYSLVTILLCALSSIMFSAYRLVF